MLLIKIMQPSRGWYYQVVKITVPHCVHPHLVYSTYTVGTANIQERGLVAV